MNQPKSRDQKNSPLAVPEGGGDDDGAEDVNESSLCLPSEQETFLPSEDRLLDKDFTRLNCLISCRFILAAYIWFRAFTVPTESDFFFYEFDNLNWHHPIFGLPTSCLIVIWKSMELFDKCKDKKWCGFSLSMFPFLGSLTVLAFGIFPSFICKDNECYDGNFGFTTVLLLSGYGTMIFANVLEAFLACCKTCCCNKRTGKRTGKICLNTFVEKIAPPVLQALAFAFFFPINNLNLAWSGLFFVWEGIVLCGLNNKTAALSSYWNAIFKILASVSFWAISGNFDRFLDKSQLPIEVVLVLPLLLLLTSFSFDAQESVLNANSLPVKALHVLFGCILPVGFLASTMGGDAGLLLISSVLLLWSLVKWLRICWMRAGKAGSKKIFKTVALAIWSIVKSPWSLVVYLKKSKDTKRELVLQTAQTHEGKGSVFHPCGEFFNFMACVLIFAQSIVMHEMERNNQEQENSDTLMLLNIGIGIFYFMHFICWIKVQFRLGENDDHLSPKYILSEDTYTLMMYANTCSQTWLISFAVFLLQAVLIAMIIARQWEQHIMASHFLDVPYDSTLSTRIGQVAGMMLILFYQKDYWVASTLLEISFWGGRAGETMKGEKIDDEKKDEEIGYKSRKDIAILFPSIIRFIQSMGVVAVSTVLILQSENIIDLVKDYTAIFFISEIDDFVFQLAFQGYLGNVLKKDTNDAKDTSVPDVKEHPIRTFGFMIIFSTMMALWIIVTNNQQNGTFFRDAHLECFNKVGWKRLNVLDYSNGKCDLDLNFHECNFDGGDCMIENFIREVNTTSVYSNCTVAWKSYIGNGRCDGGDFNTKECGYDGDDCKDFNAKNYTNCNAENPVWVGDGVCDGDKKGYHDESCGWDGGDCAPFKYPKCIIYNPFSTDMRVSIYGEEESQELGDGVCDQIFNTKECEWDGGDCKEVNKYQNCYVGDPDLIGDGSCDGASYNTEECEWDGGDCMIADPPDCQTSWIISNVCDGSDGRAVYCIDLKTVHCIKRWGSY